MKVLLNRHQQDALGKKSDTRKVAPHPDRNPTGHSRFRNSLRKLAIEQSQTDFFELDTLPETANRLKFRELKKHMKVVELPGTASSRMGTIIGFRSVKGYLQPLPIIQWANGSKSVSHPDLLELRYSQLQLF